jgi:HK97 family phage major capsid protein
MTEQEKSKTEVLEEEVIIPEETVKGLVDKVTETVKASLEAQTADIDSKIAEAVKNAMPDTPVNKGVVGSATPNSENASFGTTRATKGFEGARKEVRFMRQSKALANKDSNTLKHMNDYNLELIGKAEENIEEISKANNVTGRYVSKATYNNETTTTEGGYLIPDPEFLIAIERYEAQYGVAFANCTVRTTDRTSIKANTGTGNVTMYELGEAAQKTQTKPTYGQEEVSLRKFAAIVVASDEFIEDQAAGYWADVTSGFARERARLTDTICFTEDDASPAKRGILNTSGILTETVGSAITSLAWDDLLDTESKVLPEGQMGAKYVMHRTVQNILRKSKGTTNDHYLAGLTADQTRTPWGTPIVLSELFRSSTAGENNQPYILYGDLSKIQLWINGGLTLTYGNEGTVGSLNLFEQDLTALRAVTRFTKLITFPSRFVGIGTGSVS